MARDESDGFERNGGSTRGGTRASESLDDLIDDWLDILGREVAARDGVEVRGGPRVPEPPRPPRDLASVAADRASQRLPDVDGASLVVAFDDPAGGTVVLLRAAEHLVHRGVVAPRGPAAPTAAARQALGLTDAQTCATDFVADWFGAPFDAVNVARSGPGRLTWGIWNFSGEHLARCLARWKRRTPESFAALLSSAGVDVEAEPTGAASAGIPALILAGNRGAQAERLATGDPRIVASLARAGGHPDGQLAQIDSIVHDVLEPARAASELVQTARGLAVLLYLHLRLGTTAALQLTRRVAADRAQSRDEGAHLDAVVERLRAAGRAVDAHNVLRILSTPELERR